MAEQALYQVVITDSDLGDCGVEKQELAGIAEVQAAHCRSEAQVAEAVREADGVLVQYAPISRAVINGMRKCKVISRYGVGVDMIDLDAASERGIYVANVPDYCSEEVSDHACALILSLARKIPLLHRSVAGGCWEARRAAPVHVLQNRVLGLLGFGRIARKVAAKMSGFGVELIACDPFIPEEVFAESGVQPVGFRELLSRADILSIHLPLTAETERILGAGELEACRPGAIIVNTSRGRLLDEKALYRSLRDGRLGGAGLDVLESEPAAADHPLLGLENVIVTPHAAYYSERSLERLKRRTAQAAACILRGEAARPAGEFALVNREMLDRAAVRDERNAE
jgi:D-3-phosphoglycerate dehydrogenase